MQQYLLQDFSGHTVSSLTKNYYKNGQTTKLTENSIIRQKNVIVLGTIVKRICHKLYRYSQIQPHFEVDCPGGWHKQIMLSVEHLFNIKHVITKIFNVSYRQILVINRIDRFQ